MNRWFLAFLWLAHLTITAQAALPSVSEVALSKALPAHLDAFPEVVALRQAAKRHRGRVWVFGGAAATWVHQLKWRLLAAQGKPFFNAWPLTQRLASLLRPDQDVDAIVDAETADEARALALEIPTLLQGRRVDVWQLRWPGDKCIEGNLDIAHQHSDGHSLAVLELTKFRREPIVRDLQRWSERSSFLKEVASGALRMQWSETHARAPRVQSGMNPELYAVIRGLTKAFAFDLSIDAADRERMRTTIARWNPSTVVGNARYAQHFLVTHVPKLASYAIDLNAAWDTLDEFGLREKLAQWADAMGEVEVARLFRREPLRRRGDARRPEVSLKRGAKVLQHGRTAESIGLVGVAHDTGSFPLWDQVLRTRRDRPGFFVSRPEVKGETNSVSNTGVFASRGAVGGRQTGYPIRLRVRPDAVEGVDFFPGSDQGLERNGAPVFFATLEAIELAEDAAIAADGPAMMVRALFSRENIAHRALQLILLERLGTRTQYDGPTQRRIDDAISEGLVGLIAHPLYEYRERQWGDPERDDVIDRMEDLLEAEIFTGSPHYPQWKEHFERVRRLHRFAEHPEVLDDPALEAFLANLIDIEVDREVRERSTSMFHGKQICQLLARPEAIQWSGWVPTVEKFIRDGQPQDKHWKRNHSDLVEHLLNTRTAREHPDFLRLVSLLAEQQTVSVTGLLAAPQALAHPEWYATVARHSGNDDAGLSFLLKVPAVAARPEWWKLLQRLPRYDYWRALVDDETMRRFNWAAHVRRSLRASPDEFTGGLNSSGTANGKSIRQAIFFLFNYNKVVARTEYPSFVETLLRHDDSRTDQILALAFEHVAKRNERSEEIAGWRQLLLLHGAERKRRLPPPTVETCGEEMLDE